MWVWQSQAPAGTSKFTGVDGWAAVANTVRLGMVTPAAMEARRILRLVSIGSLLYSAAVASFARIMAAASPAARAAKNVIMAHVSEQAARKYSPASKPPVESLIQPTMKGPKWPPRFPVALIIAIAPAAAVPVRKIDGIGQNAAREP